MTVILGISAFYHDSAAAIIDDGRVVAAAQEERFSRRKHDASFPTHAVAYCLREMQISADQIDYVGFYDKPWLKFDRLLDTYLAFAPRGFRSFATAIPVWLREKLHLRRAIAAGLKRSSALPVFAEHHESHAASAFFPSPFEEAAILTMDGVGEWATATFGTGHGNRIELHSELRFPHSLGLLYSAFTAFCGFKVNSGEYKLMGLAPYGEPRFADVIRERLVDLKEDGSFWLDQSYFDYCHGRGMTAPKFARLFGGPPRQPESPIMQREMDLAASIQAVTEDIVLRMGRHVHAATKQTRLCLAGGVALNCVANGRLLREGPFEEIWIQPAAGDAGGAVGIALFIWHQLLNQPRHPNPIDGMRGGLLGPQYKDEEIQRFLDERPAVYRRLDDDAELCAVVAKLLTEQQVVGWFQGRMEFGPRALGARSILADPRSPHMQSKLNQAVKFRESFRPFAPAILQESVADYFEMRPDEASPYMLLVAPLRTEKRLPVADVSAETLHGFDRLQRVGSVVPAVTHIDYSARIQTVDAQRHGRFCQLLNEFAAITGVPLLVNTSFNVRGEPIVCTPEDAYRCFLATRMDVLVLEHFVLLKSEQPEQDELKSSAYRSSFPSD